MVRIGGNQSIKNLFSVSETFPGLCGSKGEGEVRPGFKNFTLHGLNCEVSGWENR